MPLLVVGALVVPSCGTAGSSAATSAPPLAAVRVPAVIAGLSAARDPAASRKLAATARGPDSFASDGVVYALRRGKELMAVLEILRLTPDARPGDPEFRRSIVGQIGGRAGRPRQVGGVVVYETQGNQQLIDVWFFGRLMAVLIVRADKAAAGKIDVNAVLAEAVGIRP